MSDIESMKAELEAAGYKVGVIELGDNSVTIYPSVTTPDGGWELSGNGYDVNWDGYVLAERKAMQDAIEKAYAHYQREKKFAAMEALLQAISEDEYKWADYVDMISAVDKVLGKGE